MLEIDRFSNFDKELKEISWSRGSAFSETGAGDVFSKRDKLSL